MTRYRLTRRISGTVAALLFLGGILTGTALAKPPAYTGSVIATPTRVSHSTVTQPSFVRFDVTWTNESGANLPMVSVQAVTPNTTNGAALVVAFNESQGACDDSDPALLTCTFGAVNAGASVSYSTVYKVPFSGTSFIVRNVFLAQGNTPNDPGGNSRGDDMPLEGIVQLGTGAGDGASYIFQDGQVIQNQQNLSKKNNPQSARAQFGLGANSPGFGASVSEVKASEAPYGCPPAITSCFGDWTVLSANNGQPLDGPATLVLGYVSAPGNGSTVRFVHLINPAAANPVENVDFERVEPCTYDGGTATNMPCISNVESIQGNYFFTILYEQGDSNGPMRGY